MLWLHRFDIGIYQRNCFPQSAEGEDEQQLSQGFLKLMAIWK